MKTRSKLMGLASTIGCIAVGLNTQASLYVQYAGSAGTEAVSLTYPWDGSADGTQPARSVGTFGLYRAQLWDAPSGGNKVGSEWVTVCLSPGGTWSGRQLVVQENFALATPGHLPNNWSSGGIYNAAYLYNTYVDSATGNNDKGVGLALAMLDALYDSTGKGTMSGAGLSAGSFKATAVSSGAASWYNTYIAAVTTGNINDNNYFVGSLYRPTALDGSGQPIDTSTGQDLIVKGTPVPEPTTVLAGALLLLPFGASTIRYFRKNRAA